MSDPVRKSFGSAVNARIWRTVVAAGAMIGAPAICAPEAAFADPASARGATLAPTAEVGTALAGKRVAQAKPGSGSAAGSGSGSAAGSGSGSAAGSGSATGSGTGSGSGSVAGTGSTQKVGNGTAPATQPTKRPRTKRRRKSTGRGFILA